MEVEPVGTEPLGTSLCTLGEGPVWSGREQALYWVDITAPAVHRRAEATGEVTTWRMPAPVGSLALFRSGGAALVALRTGFHRLDLGSGGVTVVCEVDGEPPGNRFNDGKCDRAGRFWAGTMNEVDTDPSGSLYRLDPGGRCVRVLDAIACSNGLGWSPDGTLMYHTDTFTSRIDVMDFDPVTGGVSGRRTFAVDEPGAGSPDGLTVDAEGFVWSAKWDGWRVVRYAPDGSVDRILEVPVPRPTSVTFGGPDLDRLYITSARYGLDPGELERAPLSGAVLVAEPGVRGLPEPEYAG